MIDTGVDLGHRDLVVAGGENTVPGENPADYGPNGEDGKPPTDLDECNGHSDKEHGYHYHVTGKFPYILGGYHGVVEASNLDRGPRQGGPGGPGRGTRDGRRGPPPPPAR